MPNLDEFLEKPKPEPVYNAELVRLGGIRGCMKCEEDVVGGFWNPLERLMTWTCSQGHENSFQVD